MSDPRESRGGRVRWSGVFAVLVTPFYDDLSIDWGSLEREVAFCLECGVDGVVGPVVAGEFLTLSDSERVQYFANVADWVGGRVPYVAGVSGVSGPHAAELAAAASRASADALIAMPPYVGQGDAASTGAYYHAVAEASSLPLVVQNPPAALSTPLSTPQILTLIHDIPTIEVVKEETFPNPQKVGRLVGALRDSGSRDIAVFGGLGGIYLFNELARGGRGTMPACQFADVVVDIFGLMSAGKEEEARKVFSVLQPALVMERLYNMTFMKACLQRRGVIDTRRTRLTEPAMDEKDEAELDAIWELLSPNFRV